VVYRIRIPGLKESSELRNLQIKSYLQEEIKKEFKREKGKENPSLRKFSCSS
jgi:hypothetical protein